MKAFHLLSPKTQGILWIISTKLSFVVMMLIVKEMSAYSSLQMNLIRGLLVMSVVFPILLRKGKKSFVTEWPLHQLIRVVLGFIAMVSFFYAYRILPMAKASALNFSFALVLPIFAFFFLKETVKLRRWIVLIVGYIGVLIVIDPSFYGFDWAEGVMILGVVCLAGDALQVKRIKTDSPYTMTFYSAGMTIFLLGTYFVLPLFFPSLKGEVFIPWEPIQEQHYFILGAMGAVAFFGHYSYIHAYRLNRLNFVAGFDYLKVVFATLSGLIFFGEIPEWNTLMGGAIILGCSYFLMRQEKQIFAEERHGG